VNGLYVTGANPEELHRLVVRELTRAGLDAEPRQLAASDLGITLVGMVHHRQAERSLATLRIAGASRSRTLRPGESVVAGVTLEEVRDDGVVLRRGAQTEFLPVYRHSSGPRRGELPAVSAPPPELAGFEEPQPGADIFSVRLSRDFVDETLDRQSDLDAMLYPGFAGPDGRMLLEVAAIAPGDLFDQLGLERGDVLMRVDGELIDERENPLWDVLDARSLVELVVARDGETRIVEVEID
jgi:type II secretory pathway component PulC